jgi:hypothetical protein
MTPCWRPVVLQKADRSRLAPRLPGVWREAQRANLKHERADRWKQTLNHSLTPLPLTWGLRGFGIAESETTQNELFRPHGWR